MEYISELKKTNDLMFLGLIETINHLGMTNSVQFAWLCVGEGGW